MKRRWSISAVAIGCLALASRGEADRVVVPYPTEPALPATARSLLVDDSTGITIMTEPSWRSPIAGKTLPRALLPALELRNAPGCRHPWVRVDASGWICGDRVDLTTLEPDSRDTSRPASGELLPWTYVFTIGDRTRAYHSLDAAAIASDDPSSFDRWEANWGMAVIDNVSAGAQRVLRGPNGVYLRRGDVYRATPSDFAGDSFFALSAGAPGVPFGWVAEAPTAVYATPDEDSAVIGRALRLSRVRIHALRTGPRGVQYARIGDDRWVRADHLRWITPEPPPAEVNVDTRERWVDVDLGSQTLIAYEGTEPMYATMVSTGGRYPTPAGTFRIWGKFLAHTMDNTESASIASHFRLGDVPYVQFFDHDRGFHAVYWHDGFGVPRSHGCVNLAPRDADYLFHFTAHPLPSGWLSRNIPTGRGTLVRIRGRYAGPVE